MSENRPFLVHTADDSRDTGHTVRAESAEDFEHYAARFRGLLFNLLRKLQDSPEAPPKTVSDLEDLLAKCEYHRGAALGLCASI